MMETTATPVALVISRTFDAPRELVFKAWTEADRLGEWWGPKGFNIRVNQLDIRPDGIFHYYLQAENGYEMWGRFVYREITSPERLIFVSSFSDAAGGVSRAPFSQTWPLEVLSTLSFTEHDGQTTMSMHGVPLNATAEESQTFAAEIQSMQQGWGGTLEQLAEHLAKG